jgi:PBSX family phage terminase large subunit
VPRVEFIFYGGAREFACYHGAEALLHGPAETGKTFSALWKLHLCALKYKNASLVILRKTQASIYATVLQTYQRKVLTEHSKVTVFGGEKPEWFDYPNGARLWLAGLDKAGKVLSAEHDIVYVNQAEELTLADWETLTTRTTGRAGHMPYSQTIGDCNPAYPSHWMYHRNSLRVFYSKHEENPSLYDPVTGEITERGKHTMSVLDALTGVRKQRLRYGLAAQAEGAIYDEWDESVHLKYASEVPTSFGRYIAGQDWGYTNAGVLGVWGVDGEGRMYLVKQVYQTGRRIDWWTDLAKGLHERYGFEVVACDPSEPAYIDAFRIAGLPAIAADNAVLPGINAVKKRLAEKRIIILRDSLDIADESLEDRRLPTSVQDEVPQYVWSDTNRKEIPVKENDHGVDMVRYSAMYLDGIKTVQEPDEVVELSDRVEISAF